MAMPFLPYISLLAWPTEEAPASIGHQQDDEEHECDPEDETKHFIHLLVDVGYWRVRCDERKTSH